MTTSTLSPSVNVELSAKQQKLIGRMLHPVWFRLFLLFKLPMALLAGIRVRKAEPDCCVVTVPHKWLNQNPFNSTYFAVLSMAGEMSTGVFGLLAVEGVSRPVSMLVVGMKSSFGKKATTTTTFTSADGHKLISAVQETLATGQSVQVEALSIGTNPAGDEVARFVVTWSFKRK